MINVKGSEKSRNIILIFFIVLAVLLFRRNDAFMNPQLWAEDYAIYFLQFEDYGIRSLIMPYGGYLHFFPRLCSGLFSYLHVSYYFIPRCYSTLEFLFTFFIAVNLWETSKYLNIKNRILYATCFLFLPLGSDIYMNLTNVNWIASVYLLNFLFTRYTDHTYRFYYLHLLLLGIISLSGPFSVMLSPIILIIFVLERKEMTLKKAVPLAMILFCGAIQGYVMKFVDPNFYRGVGAEAESYHLLKYVTNNVSLMFFMRDHFHWLSPLKTLIISICIFLVIIYNIFRAYFIVDYKRKYILLLFAIISVIAYIKAYWPKESLVLAIENPRYYFYPFLCIMWIAIIAFDKKINNIHIAMYLSFFVAHSKYIQMVLPDKLWRNQIQDYYEGKRTEIFINPEGWHFPVPKKK